MRRVWMLLGAMTLLAGVTLSNGIAQSETAGANGKITFGRFNDDIGDFDIFTANPDGSDMTEVLPGPAECPRWSADGSQIQVCVVDGQLVRPAIMDADGSDLSLVPVADPTLNLGCWAWSSSGRLACEAWDDANPNRAPGVFVLRSSDGGGLHRVTTNTVGSHDIPGDFAPGGGRIVFLRGTVPDTEAGTLYVIGTDGTGLHAITPKGFAEDFGSWSPDGRWILFSSTHAKLFVVHPDGTGLRRIPVAHRAGPAYAFQPTWSPDGTGILAGVYFVSVGEVHFYTMAADGTDVQVVEGTQGGDEFADWGVDTG
jgi:Tol biopolymer transport system component